MKIKDLKTLQKLFYKKDGTSMYAFTEAATRLHHNLSVELLIKDEGIYLKGQTKDVLLFEGPYILELE